MMVPWKWSKVFAIAVRVEQRRIKIEFDFQVKVSSNKRAQQIDERRNEQTKKRRNDVHTSGEISLLVRSMHQRLISQ